MIEDISHGCKDEALFEEEGGAYIGMQLETVETLVLLFNCLSLTDSNVLDKVGSNNSDFDDPACAASVVKRGEILELFANPTNINVTPSLSKRESSTFTGLKNGKNTRILCNV